MAAKAPQSIQFEMKLPITIKKKGKWYISSCPVLDVVTQGETEKKARSNIVEALTLFIASCYERGTLEEVLRECGFKAILPGRRRRKPFPLYDEEDMVTVPIPFLVEANGARQCHA
jgi:predicted RNase H-like HicB family nuclease